MDKIIIKHSFIELVMSSDTAKLESMCSDGKNIVDEDNDNRFSLIIQCSKKQFTCSVTSMSTEKVNRRVIIGIHTSCDHR